jgi:hypothetical protein
MCMHFLEAPIEFLEKFGANTAAILLFLGIGVIIFVASIVDLQISSSMKFVFLSAPLWLPFITFHLFFEHWLEYVRKKYDLDQGRVTLEIKIPQEVFKSPEAMELVFMQLNQLASPDNHLQTYIDGKHPPKFGFEIVSRGGDVRFYISTPKKKFKNMVETQLYAHYPGIEVHELDIDYAAEIPWDETRYQYFSIHMGLKKADAYPIKTYIEYGLDKLPKEEEKIDPINSMIEMLGSIGPGEYVWMQILADGNREETFKEGSLHLKPDWKTDAKKEIKKIIEEANKRVGIDAKKDKTARPTMMNLSDSEKETIKAIERSIGKNAFNVVIRSMYIAESEHFKPGERIGAIISSWKAYDDVNRNSIGVRWRTDVNWPWWQDPSGAKRSGYKKKELNEYKRRTYTHHNDNDTPKVMTTEELSTIFHLPSRVTTTPSLGRIPSKRAEAPPNLPI